MSARPTFRCAPLRGTVILSREACGGRHAIGRDPTCVKCPTGKAHKAGKKPELWADGTPIVFITLKPATRLLDAPMPKIRKKRRGYNLPNLPPTKNVSTRVDTKE